MYRPFPVLAVSYAAGVILGELWRPSPTCILALALGLALVALIRPWVWAVLTAFALAGWGHATLRQSVLSPDDLRTIIGPQVESVAIRGRLASPPSEIISGSREKPVVRTQWIVEAAELRRGGSWRSAHGRLVVSAPGALVEPMTAGQRIDASGLIEPPPGPRVPGLFDYRAYLRRKRIYYELTCGALTDVRLTRERDTGAWALWSIQLCEWARATLRRGLPREDESLRLLWAMVLGWKTALTDEVAEPFMKTGTMHVFAISGLHIVLIAEMVVHLLRLLGVPRSVCGGLVIPFLWAYTAATGWQASAVRSTVMMTIIIAGWTLRRPADLLNSLAGAALIILLWEPEQLFQAGFQLSFLVVLSIALFMPPVERLLEQQVAPDPLRPAKHRPWWLRRLDQPTRWVVQNTAVSIAAWIGALPLVACYFSLISPVGLCVNLLVVPLSGLALMASLGSLICGEVWISAGILFNHAAWFFMEIMRRSCAWAAEWPGAYVYVRAPSWPIVALYYGWVLGLTTGFLLRKRRRPILIAFTAFTVGALGCFEWQHRHQSHLALISVRGGECVFIDPPGTRADLLIDCGDPIAVDSLVAPFLRIQGLDQLNALVLSHGDARHVSGASVLAAELECRRAYRSAVRYRSKAFQSQCAALWQAGAELTALQRGDRIGAWEVLHPDSTDRLSQADDLALVLWGELHGWRVLLCPDLGAQGQQRLAERWDNRIVDIICASAPNRASALSDTLLARLKPQIIFLVPDTTRRATAISAEERQRLSNWGARVFIVTPGTGLIVKVKRGTLEISAPREPTVRVLKPPQR